MIYSIQVGLFTIQDPAAGDSQTTGSKGPRLTCRVKLITSDRWGAGAEGEGIARAPNFFFSKLTG